MSMHHSARVLASALFSLALAGAARAQQPARPLLEEAASALGGKDRILAVRTLVLEGSGENFNLGQNTAPSAPLPVYAVTSYRRLIDFANRRWLQDQTREPRFPAGNPAPQRLRAAFAGVAYDILADGTPRRAAARADIDRADELVQHPIGFLQVALGGATELNEAEERFGLRHVRMNAGGNKFAVFLDPRTKLPVRIHKVVYHPMLGDVVQETRFSDWRAVEGVQVPMRVEQRVDGLAVSDIRIATARVNGDVGDLTAPPAVLESLPLTASAVTVVTEEVFPGIWYLAGQSHHSVAIEMRDEVLLVEAPQSDARTLAVINEARKLRPGKPVRTLINTHHHFDHAGGVRAAMSEGLTVITHAGNKPFFDSLASRQHFIVEDAQARAKRQARVEGVDTKRVITDGARNVELHHIAGSPHAATLLMVYLPAEKLLIEADAWSPPAVNAVNPPPPPFAVNLVENIDRLGLAVDRIVPIHGRVMPMSDLRAAAATARRP